MRTCFSILNRSNYFDIERSKSHFDIESNALFLNQLNKCNSYEIRNHFEFEEIKKLGGQAFFYTLSYNDAHLPHFHGIPCHDHEDLRALLNGAFSKRVKRYCNCSLRYFITLELGEGKGSRGLFKNPHYHCIFYLRPKEGEIYNKIDPLTFRSFIREYWQGVDIDFSHPSARAKDFRFGICQEGKYFGEILTSAACRYCCKYTIKSNAVIQHYLSCVSEIQRDFDNSLGGIKYSVSPEEYNSFIDDQVKIFKNRYFVKVRCSQGLGSYGLSQVNDDKVVVPYKSTFKSYPIPLYYYRKLYTNHCKNALGNVHYYHNSKGLERLRNTLHLRIDKAKSDALKLVSMLSDKDFNLSFTRWLESNGIILSSSILDLGLCAQRYAEFSVVYKNRYYTDLNCPIDIDLDHEFFIIPVETENALHRLAVQKGRYEVHSYANHPYFSPYYVQFCLLDLLKEFFRQTISTTMYRKKCAIEETRRVHLSRRFPS
ncbi:replication initiator protein [Capybara microvirus Cap1_SP_48]|nr:replication initiator protein [Capybara microvirus Cap1_SP_48]